MFSLIHGRLYSLPMPRFVLPRTEITPEVVFDLDQGELRIEGCSIPENAEGFFRPLITRIEQYALTPAVHTDVRIFLTYFNSSSSKYLLDLLKLLNEVHLDGKGTVELEWQYEEGDLDLEEAGRDYGSLVEFPVRLAPQPIR